MRRFTSYQIGVHTAVPTVPTALVQSVFGLLVHKNDDSFIHWHIGSEPETVIVTQVSQRPPDETYFVRLTNPSNAILANTQAKGTILNDDLPPGSDLFSARSQFSFVNAIATVSNLDASKETDEPDHAGQAGGASVWWTWRAPASGKVTYQWFFGCEAIQDATNATFTIQKPKSPPAKSEFIFARTLITINFVMSSSVLKNVFSILLKKNVRVDIT